MFAGLFHCQQKAVVLGSVFAVSRYKPRAQFGSRVAFNTMAVPDTCWTEAKH